MIAVRPDPAVESDEELVEKVMGGDLSRFELLLRRHNQNLYRVARSIVGDDSEAEDIVQETYVRAFVHLNQFEGRAKFSTWLTKIAIHESFARLRRRAKVTAREEDIAVNSPWVSIEPNPEEALLADSLRKILEKGIDDLPSTYRSVVVLREINGLSTQEAAECLGISVEATKVRLHRAKTLLKKNLASQFEDNACEVFRFRGIRCDTMVELVLARIAVISSQTPQTEHRLTGGNP